MDQNISQRSVFLFFLVLFCISLILVGKVVAPFFATIILGIVATGIFGPLFRFFSRKLKPVLASVLTCAVIFVAVFVPVVLFVTILSKEAFDLYVMAKDAFISQQLKHLLEDTRALEKLNLLLSTAGFETLLSWDDLAKPISDLGKLVGLSLFEQARFITSNVFNLILYFCLMLIVVFYMLIDGEQFLHYLYDLSPLPDEHDKKLFDKFMDMAGAILIGNGLGGLIQGSAGGVLFLSLGFQSPFLWAVIMGFLAFLPIVGIGFVLIPTAVILLLTSRITAAIVVIVFYAIVSWGVEYMFKPKVVGDRVRMHPLIVFFAIIGGLKVYGLLGIIYGPLIATLFLTLADIYFTSFQSMIEPEKAGKNGMNDLE
ncbi:MAG: AI-2E family transporter [Desulfobacteraceae bacterium]|nr:MAG: AI-2E family transporter [Desulfobacteraceae bacterium]